MYKHYPSTPFMYFKQPREIHSPAYSNISLPIFSYPGFKSRNSAPVVMMYADGPLHTTTSLSQCLLPILALVCVEKLKGYFTGVVVGLEQLIKIGPYLKKLLDSLSSFN